LYFFLRQINTHPLTPTPQNNFQQKSLKLFPSEKFHLSNYLKEVIVILTIGREKLQV
ncbi:uncharacterized protein METZ01_LOCUS299514, partial [marine metagenome]